MHASFISRLGLSSVILAAFCLPPANAQDVVIGARVFGPPPSATFVGGTFAVGHGGFYGDGYGFGLGFAGGYGYRPYYPGYGWPGYGAPYWYRPHFGYGYYGSW